MEQFPGVQRRKSPWPLMLVVLVAIAIAGGGGFWYGRSYQRSNPDPIALSTSNASPVAGQAIGGASQQDLEKQFKVFWMVWDQVGKKFYHQDPLDQQKMVYGAIRGMLQSLGDDFTAFQEPESAQRSREDLNGEFEGIGAYVEFVDGLVKIVSPIEDTPAARADLRSGDVIVAVDGTLMGELTDGLERAEALESAIKLIRGPKGSQVMLSLFRPDENRQFDVTITRDAIPLISVRTEMIDDIGYINVSEFKATTADEFDKKVKELKASNPKAIILDLRNNPGGYVNQAQNLLGRFVATGVTFYEEDNDGTLSAFDVLQDGDAQTLYDLPLVVLVNGGSASASEIVSGALQDYGRGKLLGEKTFGKGSVQELHTLPDNSQLRVTIAHWLTPDKRGIHKIGIDPDYVVPFENDSEQYTVPCLFNPTITDPCGDSQLSWAIKMLRDNATPPPPPTPTATPDPLATTAPATPPAATPTPN